LTNSADRRQAREARQVDRRLGVPGAHQDPARAADQREDVAGPDEVLGARIGVRQGAHGLAALLGGDAGGEADAIVDRDRERGAEGRVVLRHHRVETQSAGRLGRQGRAQDAAGVADHERDLLRQRLGGRHDQIALVLAVGIVDHDHELAAGDRGDRLLHAVQFHGHGDALPVP
jgi:hypothetical protein